MMVMASEFQMLKRLLFNLKDYSERIDGAEANKMVQEACFEAFDALDEEEQAQIRQVCETIQVQVGRISEKGTLELLAALGDFIANNEVL